MNTPLSRRASSGALVLIFATIALLAWHAGPDANYDLRNYHLYNGFAALNGKLGLDLAPAQMQTFHAPGLDIAYFWLLRRLNTHPRLLACVLALPHAIASFVAFLIARELLPAETPARTLAALLAVLLGATGAGSLPTLATTMSEMVPASLVLGGLLVLVRGAVRDKHSSLFLGGLLLGAGAAVKLTAAIYCLGAGIALLLCWPARLRYRVSGLALISFSASLSAALIAGPWWLRLYSEYGNPLFPYFNGVFRSPFYDPVNLADRRFLPGSVTQALLYPLYWAIRPQTLVIELPTRDPRFLLSWAAIVATAVPVLLRRWRLESKESFLAVFFAASFLLWEAQFSILRYLAPLELLSGAAMLPMLRRLFAPHNLLVPSMAALCLVAIPWTVYPDWGRARPFPPAVNVEFPQLPAGSLVVLLDPSPMAYVAAFAPVSVRFVGANNNLIRPGTGAGLGREIEGVIRGHAGPLWGLEDSRDAPGIADTTLGYYGLRRGKECVQIRSNIDQDAIRLCPLLRGSRSGDVP
jgi:hypothetical protein